MKRIFGPELLENVSAEIQLLLQREERKIRLRIEKKKSKMSRKYSVMSSFFESSSRKSRKSLAIKRHSVNPIITILFVGMALKTWKRFAQRKINGELLPNDSLPYIEEEEESYEEELRSISEENDSISSKSSSLESFSGRMKRRNAEKNESPTISEENESENKEERNEDSGEKSESSSSSSFSGSSMKSDDVNRRQLVEKKKGRRMGRFSQIDLIKGFLWNKLEEKHQYFFQFLKFTWQFKKK